MSLQAANPHINATVTASAGSGKTYMLVTRILRLLLSGAEPGSILALTFTRKAAAEMQQRLAERLYQLATANDQKLTSLLQELELGDEYREAARALYEHHQYCDFPVRTLTFHSFCQDLLARFPLEADIPPGFELLESSALLMQQAREALYNEATLDMQGNLSSHLQSLNLACGSLFSLDQALNSFIHHRSDWWAYTDGQPEPLTFACQQLAQQLQIEPGADPLADFFNDIFIQQLKTFTRQLESLGGKTNLRFVEQLHHWLENRNTDPAGFQQIRDCFLKKDGDPYSQGRKDSKTLRNKLKDDADDFLELNDYIVAKIHNVNEQIRRQQCYELNRYWYSCGLAYLNHYQTIKRQQRLLDFTDLEWQSYKLLQDSDNAMWVQYKLDQQIQHLLIDEFQDTNPTQWQLLLPLLEEMASTENEKPRSVFLVGDEKQSIYSFRRAKPELQQQATEWLQTNLQAESFPLNKSWRSSPAIIETVNAIFSQQEFTQRLPGFSTHQTHHQSLPGRVEILPLWKAEDLQLEETDANTDYRNPLLQPRDEPRITHQLEAEYIAQHIKQLVENRTPVIENDHARALNYNDIFILVRKRQHVEEYEQALRQENIPYLGTNRNTFLDCLEIEDMLALLDTLLTPFNNLALAQVLKSPIFDASDDELQQIALLDNEKHWFERILQLAKDAQQDSSIERAARLLSSWRGLADKIPVHDLLDRIFDEGDVLARYQKSTPAALQGRVQANLVQFLELALDLDSGRYPSLLHFIDYLRSLHATSSDAPDEAPVETRQPRVRIMTIHASKGLEAPVVYLADAITAQKNRDALSCMIDWPVNKKQPLRFQLIPRSQQQDEISKALCSQQQQVREREDANLYYVAITRARQYLFISACQGQRGPFNDWYTPAKKALQALTDNTENETPSFTHGNCQSLVAEADTPQSTENCEVDVALRKPLPACFASDRLIAPSRAESAENYFSNTDNDQDAQQRGIAIHRMLELLCEGKTLTEIKQQLQTELSIDTLNYSEWIAIAQSNFKHPDLQHIFNPANATCFNECPVYFNHHSQAAFGIIDRVIVDNNRVILIDYKTHQHAQPDTLQQLAENYHPQMTMYSSACQQLWPDKTVEAFLLFTECVSLWPIVTTTEFET